MGIKIHEEMGNVTVMRITGQLKKSELDAVQAATAKKLDADPQLRIKLLIIVENFLGWEGSADWSDVSFYAEHGDKIEKIALVADQKLQEELMMFLGAGIRPSPLKFFLPDQLEQAREWLA
jgi:hypothetical protein